MTKVKLLTLACIGLLLLNLFLMWRCYGKRHELSQGPRNIIIERLKFDNAQIQDYDKIIATHRNQVSENQAKIHDAKNHLYALLETTAAQSTVDSLAQSIGNLHIDLEKIHYQHFNEIKSICKPNQVPYYNELVQDLSKLFIPHKPKDGKK